MSNMKDIAKKAQVSVATVSKVLNGTGNISEETTRKILEIAEELNYHPNLYARNLKTGFSRTIGILAEDLTVFNTPPVIDGIGACCEEKGYRYLLENLRINTLGIDPDRIKNGLIAGIDHNSLMKQIPQGVLLRGGKSIRLHFINHSIRQDPKRLHQITAQIEMIEHIFMKYA